ncbi:hypothetical protein MR942_10805, partial [bacterium]|nr:hypothetical protein [bacterium]
MSKIRNVFPAVAEHPPGAQKMRGRKFPAAHGGFDVQNAGLQLRLHLDGPTLGVGQFAPLDAGQ